MKYWLLIACLYGSLALQAQVSLFATPNGRASFFSKAPLEDIEAQNNSVSSLINTTTNEVSVRIPIDKFDFPNELMQEHFNDDFMESKQYPVAMFKGKINEAVAWNRPGVYDVTATGTITMHGVTQQRTITGKLQVADKSLRLESNFPLKLSDYKIKVPTLLFQKIAEQVDVKCLFVYGPYTK